MGQLESMNPALWLDAAAITATGENNAVLRWPDRSGHGRDAVYVPFVINWDTGVRLYHQPPTLCSSAINGLPAVSFNALFGQTLLLTEAGGAIDRKVEGFTAVFVTASRLIQPQAGAKYLFITHNRENHAGEQREAGNTRFAVMRNGESGAMRMHVRRGKKEASGIFEVESKSGQFGDMEWGVSTFIMDYGRNCAAMRHNGQEIATQEMPGHGPTEDFHSPVVSIASTSEGNYLTCDIAEIICFDRALRADEMRELESDLMRKVGITG